MRKGKMTKVLIKNGRYVVTWDDGMQTSTPVKSEETELLRAYRRLETVRMARAGGPLPAEKGGAA